MLIAELGKRVKKHCINNPGIVTLDSLTTEIVEDEGI
jgi:ATP adenylyltransferase